MKRGQRGLILILALGLFLSAGSVGPTQAQDATPQPFASEELDVRVETILRQLSVEERVGQLFIVNFVGQNAAPTDAISELITEYKIGGVVLMEVNNNIDNQAEDTRAQVANLTNQLQTRAFEATHHSTADDDFFLPLLVATDHEGDGYPNTRLRNNFTSIPSTMALGATWSPEDVRLVGGIVGRELASVGINVLLGPVIDVLEVPHPEGSGDINIRSFGGSPFWVGQLGRAYIRGVHQGSDGRILTVAKHFPGHGASDRLPDYEVATVNKSLAELQESDLVPFFAVTESDPSDPLGVTDAMMPSHIRYRGFQGDVTQLTRPISLDRDGMDAFMALPPLVEWRSNGLIVGDSLGVRAVKSYYDPTLQSFPAKQIAKDALMAGNDVLPLVNFAPDDQPGWFSGQLPTIESTILFFQDEYRNNEVFRERVDDAVRHILLAKLRLYPGLALEDVLVAEEMPVQDEERVISQVARRSLTLLHPQADDLSSRLPAPPRRDEEILIMGCFEDCLPFVRIHSETVRDALLDLYGPGGSDLIDPDRVHVVDFMHLYQLMYGKAFEAEEGIDEAETIVARLRDADWILLILINYMPDTMPQTGAAKLFLSNPAVTIGGQTVRFDLRDKKIVALALHAPYYLDATEIGKLSAYYAVYSKVDPSLEVALRALFQEITPVSAPPVSVAGIGYDIASALRPDPGQPLTLHLDDHVWRVGDDLRIRTGPIFDHNGNPVPDGTRVRFHGNFSDLSMNVSPWLVTDTVKGVAWAVFRPETAGRLVISASADGLEATPKNLLIAPLVSPTATPAEATRTATATATATQPPTKPPATETPRPASATPTEIPPTATTTATRTTPTVKTEGALSATATVTAFGGSTTALSGSAIIAIVGALALASLVFLRLRGRVPDEVEPAAGIEAVGDATGTVSVSIDALSPGLTGRTLGSCRVDQKIGEGGMGQVYKGYHPMLNRPVAIKVLPPALLRSEEMRSRFLQEARIAAALRHPNIVHIHDFGETDELMYLVMEYIDGTSLQYRLDGLRNSGEMMPVTEAVGIASQTAHALAYAHEQDAVHRDLKPANVLLSKQGQAILVDFGLAVLRGGPRYTEPGKVWGSPTYIAPEQLGESPRSDARSDIYSLATVLYEMVTGKAPFTGESVMEVLWQKANITPRPPRELAPDISPELAAIIVTALSKNPDDRYKTAHEMANALDALKFK